MSWMITSAGHAYHLDGGGMARNPIELNDIAHALAQINRFTGHARRPYSVAEHSLLVADIIGRMGGTALAQLAGLMHDAHEAFVGDLSSPLKWALGKAWLIVENNHAHEVRKAFGLTVAFAAFRDQVHKADLVALATERRDLMPYTPGVSAPWAVLDTPGREIPACDASLNDQWRTGSHWTAWRVAFCDRFHFLRNKIGTEAAV